MVIRPFPANGKFVGQTFGGGLVAGDPEGLVVVDGPNGGYVILTDPQPQLSTWYVFARSDYRRLGAWTGTPAVANTDGICVLPRPFGPFKSGALFAVNDYRDVRAYELEAILGTIR